MSDAGEIEAVQADIVVKVRGADECGVAGVYESLSVDELVRMDAEGQLPAVMVAYVGYENAKLKALGSRLYFVDAEFEICVAVRDERSLEYARTKVLEVIARARDRVHFAACGVNLKSRYLFRSERVERITEDVVAGVARVHLKVELGR